LIGPHTSPRLFVEKTKERSRFLYIFTASPNDVVKAREPSKPRSVLENHGIK